MTLKQQQQRGRWLLAALQKNHAGRARELIGQGADVSVRGPDGETALYTALASGCFAAVKPLLEAGADPNVPAANGSYPLHLAAEYGNASAPQLVELLAAHGARIDVRDEEGATAVFLAGKSASAETVQTLVRHGANISDRNNVLDTALTFACCWGMTDRAAMLLNAGIDIEAQDDNELTALHWAARDGHAGTVALLLNRGALVNVADRWGRTALLYAAGHGSQLCVAHLLAAGADPQSMDKSGQTALSEARRYAGRDLAEALRACDNACHSVGESDRVFVERFITPDGEPAVRIGSEEFGWTRELCDGFDAIVQLLEPHAAIIGTTDS